VAQISLSCGSVITYENDAVSGAPKAFFYHALDWSAHIEWHHDARGLVSQEKYDFQGGAEEDVLREYTYDSRGFLTEEREGGSLVKSYAYSPGGRMTSMSDVGGARSLVPSPDGKIDTGELHYEYDKLGRVIQRGDLVIEYGPDGQIARARRGEHEHRFYYD